MHEVLFERFGVAITGWKLVGYLGVLMFTSRWLVQLYFSQRAGRPVLPRIFWVMSICGSFFCLLYFIFGKNDSVGIISSFFPMLVAVFNLAIELKGKKR